MWPHYRAIKEEYTSFWGKYLVFILKDVIVMMGSDATECCSLVVFIYNVDETIIGKAAIVSMAMLDCPSNLNP